MAEYHNFCSCQQLEGPGDSLNIPPPPRVNMLEERLNEYGAKFQPVRMPGVGHATLRPGVAIPHVTVAEAGHTVRVEQQIEKSGFLVVTRSPNQDTAHPLVKRRQWAPAGSFRSRCATLWKPGSA